VSIAGVAIACPAAVAIGDLVHNVGKLELAAAAHGTPAIVALALLLAAVIGVALLRWSMST
jgi:hypothetical protein